MDNLLEAVPAHLEEVLSTLKVLQGRLDAEMAKTTTGLAGSKSNTAQVKMATQLASASAALGRECRAWLKRVNELASTASLEERLSAVRLFILDLPDGLRKQLLKEVTSGTRK